MAGEPAISPERGTDRGHRSEQAHGAAGPCLGDRLADKGHGKGHHAGRAEAPRRPGNDQQPEQGRNTAQHRGRREQEDPVLVRAGRGLGAPPRALELRERVSQVVLDGQAVLHPAERLNLMRPVRTFTLRAREELVENFGPELIARAGAEAPGDR